MTQTGTDKDAAPRQWVTVLGATGSIGAGTLDVMARHRQRWGAFALTAHTQVDALWALCQQWRPRFAVMASAPHAAELRARCRTHALDVTVLEGQAGLCEVAAHPQADAVMAAIVGAAGLAPCMAAAAAGKRLLLANKEALVVGGAVFMEAVRAGGATLLPIDSEHSAIFQCLPQDSAVWPQHIERLLLTSSGGPLRCTPLEALEATTPEQACAHPNFVMGRKISVDSATMMNKALEVIEAHWLFGVEPQRIEVLIHPQQIIHSMVQFHDMSVLAQLGTPDMRVPIAYGLSWPQRVESGAQPLDFAQMAALTFERPVRERYPCLFLAWEALRAAPGTTAVLNAANEVAVEAFLQRRMGFAQIHRVIAVTLAAVAPQQADTPAALMELDARARAVASGQVRAC